MTKALVLVVALAAAVSGCSNGGAQEAGPVPTSSGPTATASGNTGTSTGGGSLSSSTTPLCSSDEAKVALSSQEGAAGTIRTVWRVKNTSGASCRSFGYPGMDFRASGSWQDVQVHRGGYPDINVAPTRVVVSPGDSLYFVSYWSDVDTNAGPCKDFDRVKVTLPDNFTSAEVASSGCIDPGSVRVGPVSTAPPSL